MGRDHRRPLHWKELRANRLLRACARLAAACDRVGTLWIWENPRPSLMWRTRPWTQLFRRMGQARCYSATVDWCRWGRKWKKSTLFRGRAPWLPQLHSTCIGGHVHEVLQGGGIDVDGNHRRKTAIAAEYSPTFCAAFADLADANVPRTRARYGLRGVRVGEASHPGPQRKFTLVGLYGRGGHAPVIDMDASVTWKTQVDYNVQLDAYDRWALQYRFPLAKELARRDISVVVDVMAAYLQALAARGKGASAGRYFYAGFIKEFPDWQGRLGRVRKKLDVWSLASPKSFTVPWDEGALQAAAAVALTWDWPGTAAALILAFYALLRVTELCGLCWGHVRVYGSRYGEVCAVSVLRPKTRYRAARIQGVLIRRPEIVSILKELIAGRNLRHKVVAGTQAALSGRSKLLLGALGVDAGALDYQLGGLRGGGAIAYYASGEQGPSDMVVTGRWDSLRTATHYLQEALAVSTFARFGGASQRKIDELAPLLSDLAALRCLLPGVGGVGQSSGVGLDAGSGLGS